MNGSINMTTANTVPKYCQIKSMIINMIKTGKFKENTKIYSESMLAKEFYANRNTVAKALNELVLEGYIYRKQGIGSFVSPQKPKQKTGNIGVVVHNVENKFYSIIARYVEAAAKQNDYHVILCNTEESLNTEREVMTSLVENNKVDGIITTPINLTSHEEQKLFVELQQRNMPFVQLFPHQYIETMNQIFVDYYQGAKKATEMLFDYGRRNICFVITKNRHYYDISQRIKGFREVVESRGFDFTMIDVPWPDEQEGYNLSKKIIDMPERPDGVVAVNDETAIGLLKGFRDQNISVPEDIALVGFDDINYASDYSIQLSTIRYDYPEMCDIAVKTLLKQIGQSDFEPVHKKVKTTKVIRKTCTPKA